MNSAPSNVVHPAPHPAPPPSPHRAPPSRRPHSIGELAELAKRILGEDPRPFKSWLRIAEYARRDAKTFQEHGDLDSTFVEYAKAATIVLEKIPAHPDYRVLLSTTQRHNMGLHGQEILDSLAEIKISIMTRYEQWRADSLMSQHQISQGYHVSLNCDPVAHNLKTVSLPRDCMKRFTSISSINTAKNKETCGLLLGQNKGRHYEVTTLLIPKQRATSDTCVIDEEELVTQFMVGRLLFTLGWIHTHPTQSCFMSSVDLHRHSGFQQILPESFAVVCAPNSTPSLGIFQLTDPGLQIILRCAALEAFHPHPDGPIYTNVDNGHVKISDLPLEIVDLREHTDSLSTDGLIALPSRRRVVALQSEDTLEVVKGPLSRPRRPKAGHDGEEEEEVTHAVRTAGRHDEPISEPETPKQRPVALQPKTPAQRSNVTVSHKSTLPSVNHSDGLPLPTDTSMRQSEAAANPTSEVFEGFDMLHRPPESQLHDQQPEYLRILQDKFGTPRPDHGNRHSFTDYNSSRNEGDGNYRESFVDPDNESSNVRCSVKTVSKGSLLSPNILSPASSQLTSRFN